MEHLRCVVERITYQNSDNGYSVIKCRAKGYQDLVITSDSIILDQCRSWVNLSEECLKRNGKRGIRVW